MEVCEENSKAVKQHEIHPNNTRQNIFMEEVIFPQICFLGKVWIKIAEEFTRDLIFYGEIQYDNELMITINIFKKDKK